jgi:hypothetical protein
MTPRSKLRHENSQIHFEAINSSPLVDQESQLLTERQREVAERQRLNAPMFSDISSPARKRAIEISSDPLNSDVPDERPSTPILQPALDDDLPGSSPTVASVSRRQSLSRRVPPKEIAYGPWRDDEDIPSSPPRVEDEEDDSGARAEPDGTTPTLRQATISPMRLQSSRPEDSSHDILLEKARREFAMAPDELPVADSQTALQSLSALGNEEPRSSLDRELVKAQIAAEAYVSSGMAAHEDKETRRGDVSEDLTSSMVADSTEDKQTAVKSSSGGLATDPISSETFMAHATEPLPTHEATSKAWISAVATGSADTQYPETQHARRSKAGPSGIFDNSCIADPFSNPEFERDILAELSPERDQAAWKEASKNLLEINPGIAESLGRSSQPQGAAKRKRGRPRRSDQTQMILPTESLSDQDRDIQETWQDLHEDESQLSASIESASKSHHIAKRKPGRPKQIKIDDLSYLMGIGNLPARPPLNHKAIFDDDADKQDLIVFRSTPPEHMEPGEGEGADDHHGDRLYQASFQLIDTTASATKSSLPSNEKPTAVSQSILDTRLSKIPSFGRRSSSRLSQIFMDSGSGQNHSPEASSPPSDPSLSKRQSSRLSGMSIDSPTLDQSSLIVANPRSHIQKNNSQDLLALAKESPNPTQQTMGERRTSGRLSQTANNREHVDSLPPVRRRKRSLSQSQDAESQASEELIVSSNMYISKRRKLGPYTPQSNLRSSQKAFVQVTPGDNDSRRTSTEVIVPGDEHPQNTTADKVIQPTEIGDDTTEPPAHTASTQQSQESQEGGDRSILTPKSILARLRNILSDCKSMVFGSQEQREMDDVLFEVKSEVFRKRES